MPRGELPSLRSLASPSGLAEPRPELREGDPSRRGRKPACGDRALRQEVERLRKQCARQQALLRVQQRALGVQAAGAERGGKKRRRPRKKRTLRLIEGLTGAHDGAAAEAAPAQA